jgi:hypothetical protein
VCEYEGIGVVRKRVVIDKVHLRYGNRSAIQGSPYSSVDVSEYIGEGLKIPS